MWASMGVLIAFGVVLRCILLGWRCCVWWFFVWILSLLFRIMGLGLRVKGLGFRVLGLGV